MHTISTRTQSPLKKIRAVFAAAAAHLFTGAWIAGAVVTALAAVLGSHLCYLVGPDIENAETVK